MITDRFSFEFIPQYSMEDLKKFVDSGDRFVIFGAGEASKDVKRWLFEKGKSVSAFLDNNIEKAGQLLDGVQIYHPNQFDFKNKKIIIVSHRAAEISRQLIDSIGLHIFKDFIASDYLGWIE